jgi:hypothetical protein
MEKEKVLTERLGVMNRRAFMGLAVQTAGEAIPGAETFKRKITTRHDSRIWDLSSQTLKLAEGKPSGGPPVTTILL